ncbi:helix-turn-helix domain containing protein [Paraclostridium dentum]|uniref:helix-turn-helix domain containing protein n=1 Tax=Paraclostridium dentum TaxID=2662455 RepID=UPI001474A7A0|nr:helix-turn-helix domain containing protein [Paraclostridium dentum]
MSKIDLIREGKVIDTIENQTKAINKHIVIVDIAYVEKLKEANIPFSQFDDDFYLVKRGKKKKRFNKEQVQQIKRDLNEGISIRAAATKYNTSTRTIQDIKIDKY